jgi:hypothetical protein
MVRYVSASARIFSQRSIARLREYRALVYLIIVVIGVEYGMGLSWRPRIGNSQPWMFVVLGWFVYTSKAVCRSIKPR